MCTLSSSDSLKLSQNGKTTKLKIKLFPVWFVSMLTNFNYATKRTKIESATFERLLDAPKHSKSIPSTVILLLTNPTRSTMLLRAVLDLKQTPKTVLTTNSVRSFHTKMASRLWSPRREIFCPFRQTKTVLLETWVHSLVFVALCCILRYSSVAHIGDSSPSMSSSLDSMSALAAARASSGISGILLGLSVSMSLSSLMHW